MLRISSFGHPSEQRKQEPNSYAPTHGKEPDARQTITDTTQRQCCDTKRDMEPIPGTKGRFQCKHCGQQWDHSWRVLFPNALGLGTEGWDWRKVGN